jgi:hypothetical protein
VSRYRRSRPYDLSIWPFDCHTVTNCTPVPVIVAKPLREQRQWRVGGLVEDQQYAGVDRRASAVVAVEGLADEVGEQRGEHRSDSMFVAEWCDEVQRVASGEQPVEGDLATHRTGFDTRLGPKPRGVSCRRVVARARPRIGLPVTLQVALHLIRCGSDRRCLVLGQQTHEWRQRPGPVSSGLSSRVTHFCTTFPLIPSSSPSPQLFVVLAGDQDVSESSPRVCRRSVELQAR